MNRPKTRGRKAIPVPNSPEEADFIARYGSLGTDPWMQYFAGNPFLQGEAMEEAIARGSVNLRLDDLKRKWALQFGMAIGDALTSEDQQSIERFAHCAKAVLVRRQEPYSDPSGYDIAALFLLLCWSQNRPIKKSDFVAYCRKSKAAHHRFMPDRDDRQVDRLLKWARAALERFPKSTTK